MKKQIVLKKIRLLVTFSFFVIIVILTLNSCLRSHYPTFKEEWNFAMFAARNGLWQEARFRFENLSKKMPNSASVHNNLAISLEAVGEFEAAEKEYERSLNLDPNNTIIKENFLRLKQILKERVVEK